MKKILAVLLAALFVVSMSTMAFAATSATASGLNKTKYEVGSEVDLAGLKLTYKDGDVEKSVFYDVEKANFAVATSEPTKEAGKKNITITYKNGDVDLAASVEIEVVAKETTTAAPTTEAPKLTLIEELNKVRTTFTGTDEDLAWAYAEVISRYAEDVDAITARQKLVQGSSLYPDNWNEFVKIFTDYVPTAVNQQLDIAARLGWDASDQDFVQDVIDLVKGAAESDAAADNGSNGGSTTDANPKTGSASAIAVFAVLSVAAAAVVCTKKKED